MNSILAVFFCLLFLAGIGTYMKSSVNHSADGGERTTSNEWIGKQSPELSDGDWINSPPLKLSGLRGRVVLLEFWTFGCYNCRNTIPTMNEYQKKYAGKEFTIIGVHTPEFDREKNLSNVRERTAQLGINYAVVTDNDYTTWESYNQQYWPVMYLIDKKGIIRYVHIGEGSYDTTEKMIQSLIDEHS